MPKMPKRIVPVSSAVTARTARSASSAAPTACSAYGRRDSPAALGTTPRPTRWNSSTPSERSSSRICSETDGWAYPSSSAAAVRLPCSYVVRKHRSWCKESIGEA